MRSILNQGEDEATVHSQFERVIRKAVEKGCAYDSQNRYPDPARLREALSDFAQNPESTVIRDGVIQRFEFTFELAWKSLREYLEDQEADMSGIVFSKQVFKAAYAAQAAHRCGHQRSLYRLPYRLG